VICLCVCCVGNSLYFYPNCTMSYLSCLCFVCVSILSIAIQLPLVDVKRSQPSGIIMFSPLAENYLQKIRPVITFLIHQFTADCTIQGNYMPTIITMLSWLIVKSVIKAQVDRAYIAFSLLTITLKWNQPMSK